MKRFTLKQIAKMPKRTQLQPKPWDLVRLKTRTDRYRVYSYEYEPGKTRLLFVGQNSDTVTDDRRDQVTEIIREDQPQRPDVHPVALL